MLRDWNLQEVTDGKLYTDQDMVRVGCNDCAGCSDCCRTVGDSILLDPYDIWQLTSHLQTTFEALLEKSVELGWVDGLIQPHLALADAGGCTFLDSDGRCLIHSFRPGICRLFPLGRLYEHRDYRYILQVHECPKPNKTKVKISKWLQIDRPKEYHDYIVAWHYFLRDMMAVMESLDEAEKRKQVSMYLLTLFFATPYSPNADFYAPFYRRLKTAQRLFSDNQLS